MKLIKTKSYSNIKIMKVNFWVIKLQVFVMKHNNIKRRQYCNTWMEIRLIILQFITFLFDILHFPILFKTKSLI